MLHDKSREQAVARLLSGLDITLGHREERRQGDTHQQEHGKLREDDKPADGKRPGRVSLTARRQVTLHHQLIRTMGRHGQKCAAHHTRPKGHGGFEKTGVHINQGQLFACAGVTEQIIEACGQGAEDHPKGRTGAQDVNGKLDAVVPNHRSSPANERIDDGQQAQRNNGRRQIETQHDM